MFKYKFDYPNRISEIEVVKETKNYVYIKGRSRLVMLAKVHSSGGIANTVEEAFNALDALFEDKLSTAHEKYELIQRQYSAFLETHQTKKTKIRKLI